MQRAAHFNGVSLVLLFIQAPNLKAVDHNNIRKIRTKLRGVIQGLINEVDGGFHNCVSLDLAIMRSGRQVEAQP